MNRDLLYALLGAGVLMWAGVCSAGDSDAELRVSAAEAAVELAESEVQLSREREFRALVALDSATAKLALDSARWEAERDSLATRARAANVRASAVATDLTAGLDSTSNALFRTYQAEVASVIEAKDSLVATLQAERTALYATIATHVEYEATLYGSLTAERDLSAQYRAAWEAEQSLRRSAERQGLITKGLAVGGLGKVCYDGVNDGNLVASIGGCGGALIAGIS